MKLNLFLILPFFTLFNLTHVQGQKGTITFMPQWLPQAQFAGYYMAMEKGFYKEEGIDVKIVHPSASLIATESLKNGDVDVISLFLVSAITSVDKGVNLVNIAQLSQNSGLLFVAKKDKKISSITDLNGKKVGIWKSGFDEIPKSVIQTHNLKVTWVPLLSSVNMFMMDGIDAMTVMWYNEYDQIINSGYNPEELKTFFFSDLGFNIPEDGLYCLDSTYQNKKEELQKFVRATLKGWEYARKHQEETIQVVLNYMKKEHVPTNYAHQKWMLEKMLQLMTPKSVQVKNGVLQLEHFNKAHKLLYDGKFISKKINYSDFFKPVL